MTTLLGNIFVGLTLRGLPLLADSDLSHRKSLNSEDVNVTDDGKHVWNPTNHSLHFSQMFPRCLPRLIYWVEELLSVQEGGLNDSCMCRGEIYCPTYEHLSAFPK